VFNFEQEDVQNHPVAEIGPMGGKSRPLSLEKAARAREARAAIGRELRRQFDAPQPPLSERLAELLKEIEQSADE
jgi:hypothetical protein